MEIKGKIYQVLPITTGESAKGEWRSQEIVIETEGEYPKKICVKFFGDKVDISQNLKELQEVTAYINLESREYMGRWYTSANCWRISLETTEQSPF
ncbi:MAG: DUF3127 domain-containing protein [Muribaculaceae bacterium]